MIIAEGYCEKCEINYTLFFRKTQPPWNMKCKKCGNNINVKRVNT